MKEFVRRSFPRMFVALRGIKDQLMIEGRTIRTVGMAGMIAALRPRARWESELPIQSVRRVSLPGLAFAAPEQLLARVEISASGAHSAYLAPDRWAAGPLAPLKHDYPDGCGLKLMKRPGGVETPYVMPGFGAVQERLLPTHRQQILTMNFLHEAGLAPRLYDLIEIDGGAASCVAYVVEHAPGGAPAEPTCMEVIAAIRRLVASGRLRLINWYGFDDRDFQCPECNGNLRTDAKGVAVYVDTQNFGVAEYGRTLIATARDAQEVSHFGDRTHLLGGRYLYQAVPGVQMPAKRDPAHRMAKLKDMLGQAGLAIEGRAILDIGCNIGLMGAQYLKNGALWLHGWDMPQVVEQTRRILLATGCTRFSLTGTQLGPDTDLLRNLPAFLGPHLEQAVVSYLAIRGHVGWLPSLGTLPWAYMIYEGHEDEDDAVSRAQIAAFSRTVPVDVLAERQIADGTSRPRYVSLLRRRAESSSSPASRSSSFLSR